MKRGQVGLALGALIVMGAVLALPSCGHSQKLVSLQIQPQTFTFLTPAGTEQYSAIATYIHPPATKNVTSQATWAIDDNVVTFTGPGAVTPTAGACGGGTISATMPEGTGGSQNVTIGYGTVTVDDPSISTCPGGGTVAALNVGISGNGSITSLPIGISCPSTCSASFDVGASVLLTATPATGLSTTWGNCTSFTGNLCTITVPAGGAAVTATFQ